MKVRKNNKTMFTADFTATDDENRSEYASSLEYEYDPWVNSYNDIIGDKIIHGFIIIGKFLIIC